MKKYIILGIVIFVVIFLNYIQCYTLKKSAKDITGSLDNILTYLNANLYENAILELDNLESIWNKNKGKWDVFTEHDDVEEISSSLVSLKIYVKNSELVDSLNEVALIYQRVSHILENESVSLATVF